MIYRYENQAFDLNNIVHMSITGHAEAHEIFFKTISGDIFCISPNGVTDLANLTHKEYNELLDRNSAKSKLVFDEIFKHWQATKRPSIKVEGD